MTLRTALARLLVQMEADGKSPLTISVYRTELARFVAWAKPGTEARRIRPDTLARYFAGVSPMVTAAGAPRSPRTVNRAKAAVRLLFRYLADTGAIPRDPSRVLKNARTDRPIPTVLSEAEARAFAKALAEPTLGTGPGRPLESVRAHGVVVLTGLMHGSTEFHEGYPQRPLDFSIHNE